MTLAETASIFCENIVTDAILDQAGGVAEELAVLDSFLQGASYLTLEIYGRYLFESEVFERRQRAELSADDFCELATQVNHRTLGDTIVDGDFRPYDWARLPHYYKPDLSFYNYPLCLWFPVQHRPIPDVQARTTRIPPELRSATGRFWHGVSC